MIIGQFVTGQTKNYWFYIGWFAVFAFALSGTILELINGQTCPKSSSGMPMCYVSLLLAITIAVLFFMSVKMNQKSGTYQ